MSVVSLLGVKVLNNPATFTSPYKFEITFECLEQLQKGECAADGINIHCQVTGVLTTARPRLGMETDLRWIRHLVRFTPGQNSCVR